MDASIKSLKTREMIQDGSHSATMMIPEEDYPASKSITDTSQPPESKADITDRDLLREFERQDPDDDKRRT